MNNPNNMLENLLDMTIMTDSKGCGVEEARKMGYEVFVSDIKTPTVANKLINNDL